MRKRALAEINVVPYIDVMLVLLVIFMITAPLLTQGVNVKLPQAAAKTLFPQQAPIIVSIDSHGSYFLNIAKEPSQPITTQDLVTRVAAALQLANQNHQKQEIYVKGDKEVDYGKVVQMMVLLKYAGANNVGLMTQNLPS
ncbi:protein TolR [Coxiella-like endosymbiont of Rhipicephalus sanguineus]|uniref:protein TolR n=1 Tax=Coxiella-like endosymbiont of Rhipicephalus sanguineus TaxID=1955402 RepID=UPI00203D3496|nr:protein TolR [Coxiella-like endosymbiont of Rhipicephalus sanguineus]MBT8506609.1 protein TolR [Coxiella-like endosymbiont of Rhipicephalus sanguineus]